MIQIIIPARFSSVRLPGKPLIKLNGKEMIDHVYSIALDTYNSWDEEISMAKPVIATDSSEIIEFCTRKGINYYETGAANTGTDRVAYVAKNQSPTTEYIVNLQGDEPVIGKDFLYEFCIKTTKLHDENKIVCGICPLPENRANDLNNVKAVVTTNGLICFLTRLAQPSFVTNTTLSYYKQIGLYGFKRESLFRFCEMPPSNLEQISNIELMRWIDHGYKIASIVSPTTTYSVDIVEDTILIERILEIYNQQRG